MNVEQRLRSALRDGAASMEVPEPGPGAARERARQRGRRTHGLVAAAVVAALAGGVLTVWGGVFGPAPTVLMDSGGGEPGTAQAEPLTLAWRDAEGVVGRAREAFLGSDGVYYALSTAPGARHDDYPAGDVPQALYQSDDGLHWEAVPLGDEPWIAGLGERDGLLYALSTAPGAQGGSGQVALSDDQGRTWQRADLPSAAAPPDATVALREPQVTGHIAVGEDVLVAAVRTRYQVDIDAEFAEELDAGHFVLHTPDGLAVHESGDVPNPADPESVTVEEDGAVEDSAGSGSAVDESRPAMDERIADTHVPAEPVAGSPLRTVTWAEMGLDGPQDLAVDEMFVSRDGTGWEAVTSPFEGREVRELAATPHGFLAALHAPAQEGTGGTGAIELLHSTDGADWEPLDGEDQLQGHHPFGGFGVVDDHRLVAVPQPGGSALVVTTSDDGGRSWSKTDLGALLPGDGYTHVSVLAFDTGPLGAALVAVAVEDVEDYEPDFFLLTSPDAVTWSATPLEDVLGGDPHPHVSWVAVGRDAITLGATWPPAGEGAPGRTRTFVGTPTR